MMRAGHTPDPEKLAAFVDGELRGCEQAHVARWIASCPQAAADVEALRRLAEHCRQTVASEPTSAQWNAVLAKVAAALPSGTQPKVKPRRRPYALMGAGLAAAACLLTGILLSRSPQPDFGQRPTPPPTVVGLDSPMEFIDPRDVEVIGIDGGYAGDLLVGLPLGREPLEFAEPTDIVNVKWEPSDDLQFNARQQGGVPMVVPTKLP